MPCGSADVPAVIVASTGHCTACQFSSELHTTVSSAPEIFPDSSTVHAGKQRSIWTLSTSPTACEQLCCYVIHPTSFLELHVGACSCSLMRRVWKHKLAIALLHQAAQARGLLVCPSPIG